MNTPKYALAAVLLPLFVSSAQAVEFTLKFEEADAGIRWTGIVDSTADTLAITAWDVTGNQFYPTSNSLPMMFSAVSGEFGSYDVPDDWDGNLENWGFISDNTWLDYQWTNAATEKDGGDLAFGGINPPPLAVGLTLEYTPSSIQQSGDLFFITPEHFARTYTDTHTLASPLHGANLTATSMKLDGVEISAAQAVPEPSSALLLLVGAAGALVRRKR